MISAFGDIDVAPNLPIVLIGGGVAAISCGQVLSSECPQRTIVIITASNLLKVTVDHRQIGRNIDEFNVTEQDRVEFESKYKNVKVILGEVVELNSSDRCVTLSNGNIIKYSKLCICTGSHPKVVQVDDEEKKKYILTIRDTESVINLKNRLANAKRVLVIGNGGISTELVYELESVQVVWCIRDSSISATFFDPAAAQFLRPVLKSEQKAKLVNVQRIKYTVLPNKSSSIPGSAVGPQWVNQLDVDGALNAPKHVTIECNCELLDLHTFEQLTEDKKQNIQTICSGLCQNEVGWPIYAELTNGKVYGCDFVISATGVMPNTEPFLKGNDFEIGADGGFKVNNNMLTSLPDVYAAGDVCTPGWNLADHWFQMRLWTQARLTGMFAGYSIASNINSTDPQLYFNFDLFAHVTKFFGYKVVLLGLFNGQKLDNDYEILLRITSDVEFVKVVMKNGKMQGAILIGDTDLDETFENLILNQLDLSSYGDDLLNTTLDIEDYFD